MRIFLMLLLTVSLLGLGACKKKEGPLEKAGKKVDKLFDDAGKKMDE